MKWKPNKTCGVRTRRSDLGPTRRKRSGGRVAPCKPRERNSYCACGRIADCKTSSGWVCRRCLTLEDRGYDRFTGVLRREPVEKGGSPHDNGQ